MSSTYPITKSVRWRMKDWVSCFNVCRLPTVDEEKETNLSISPPFPTTSVQNYQKGEMTRKKLSDRQRKIDNTCNEDTKGAGAGAGAGIKVSSIETGLSKNSSIKSHMSSEEEYIEFCFENNGEIHAIDQKKSSNQIHQSKVLTGKTKENADQWRPDEIIVREYCRRFVEESNNEAQQEEGPILESRSASNLSSDGSTTSFSFPVLSGRSSWEWMGGPVLIPRPEEAAPSSSNSIGDHSHLHSCRF